MLALETEYLFDYCGRVRPFSEWLIAGDGGWGTRVIAPVVSGTVEGPKLKGVIADVGADWFVLRHDNVFAVDVRIAIQTDDGAYIHVQYEGVVDLPEDLIAEIMTGRLPQFVARVHTAPRFETGHEKYLWLNKIQAVAIGEVNTKKDPPEVCYSVYALR